MTVIAGSGTPESTWLPWLTTTGWAPAVPPAPSGEARPRALVLAAHPDDEVLGAGGLLHRLGRDGWRVDVVWASDGEASHPGSTVLAPGDLARRRRQESQDARGELGLDGSTTWLALPDSGLQPHEDDVAAAVDHALAGARVDLLVAPWNADGHPDHEVCGRVALAAGRRHGVPVWEVPIWAWHWAQPADVGRRWPHARTVTLDEPARTAKATAVQRFVTQVHPVGPAEADRAVLPDSVLVRFSRPFEVVLCTPAPTAGAS